MNSRESIWEAALTTETRTPIVRDMTVDVAVIGAGITGLTAAILLADAGLTVAILEARTIGSGVSSRTTAHATQVVDARYDWISRRHGDDVARAVATSSAEAIRRIERFTTDLRIPCGFVRRPGYLFTEKEPERAALEREEAAMHRLGLEADLLDAAPLPFATRGALRLQGQAQFHPGSYLAGLARGALQRSVLVFDGTRVLAVEDGAPCHVHTAVGPTVRATSVFVATHVPTINRVLLQTKLAAYRSYVVAYPGIRIEDGLFWDMNDPYHYFSSFPVAGNDYLILGGEDHKTGKRENGASPFGDLERFGRERFAASNPEYRWSAQVEEPVDGLPYIGRNSLSKNVYVATGFGGNGTTFGTLAAMIVTDLVRDRPNPWAVTYEATRMKPLAAVSAYLRENVAFPIHLLEGERSSAPPESVDEIRAGEGRVLRVSGRRLAIARDEKGELHTVSAVCTHLGCVVRFNSAERSWDCPCHGSRFDVDGRILDGPATRPLPQVKLPKREP